jgi:cytochrome c oxidase assembly factor CtaG
VETRARISEISTFLAVMARWLRESRQREIATHRDWAYSGGW